MLSSLLKYSSATGTLLGCCLQKDEENNEQLYDMIDRVEQNKKEKKYTRYRKNICEIMLPNFNLTHLDNLADFLPLHRN